MKINLNALHLVYEQYNITVCHICIYNVTNTKDILIYQYNS